MIYQIIQDKVKKQMKFFLFLNQLIKKKSLRNHKKHKIKMCFQCKAPFMVFSPNNKIIMKTTIKVFNKMILFQYKSPCFKCNLG